MQAKTKLTDNVLEHIEYYKTTKPSIYAREIRGKLLEDGICTPMTLPGLTKINVAVRENFNMSRKIISSVLAESCTDRNIERQLDFMEEVSNYTPEQLHWFDESSVVQTTGNRRYGHSVVGTQAVEIQRYASNATFTVNLLMGVFGIHHVDVILGPSNGYEFLKKFHEAIEQNNDMGNPVLAPGDYIIMDNCPFHHARHVEQNLRRLLDQLEVRLIFQPPYNPQFNVCEYCFRHLKFELRSNPNPRFVYNFTELAVADKTSCRQDSL
ncbi:uncharacterized protein LOC102806130 [Saccoglossus kowalevskii]|uniref:Uncharacterized protein LOC102806130 n=1 Tax=Saccoglossus kowalevskii TaxID=10224 RepID=A0ABM0MAG8_SACKO|nr:PREDICTED: uncharacterized protein LOC102806130 [Saccoglossus kowalevskii]